ncbi:hypothetical protein EV426DRAFT_628728 [Tirmania nivea]|nr:hypothetical protein EV426DRAFT_628728 [Tirmania nivea]
MSWYFVVAIALTCVFGAFLFPRWPWVSRIKVTPAENKTGRDNEIAWPPPINPLPDLTPETLPQQFPTPWRPYKPLDYQLTMGLSSLEPSQWIQIDNGYTERIAKRKALIENYPTVVYGFKPEIVPAIEELYEYLLGYYLPKRYPGLFRIRLKGSGLTSEDSWLENLVTGECHPIVPPTAHTTQATASERAQAADHSLRAIATTIEEDFLILLPDSLLPDGGEESKYKLRAFCMCFASGVNPSDLLGKPLTAIHALVPGYKAKLEMSIDRFFGRMQVGRLWRRWNWGITTHNELCFAIGNETYEREMPKPMESSDPAQAHLRVEYQTMTRLPNTQAVVFTSRTYLTPLAQIRNDPPPIHAGTERKPEPGYGTPNGGGGPEDLADAIEGIKGPLIEYKKVYLYKERVVRYLRTGEK